MMTIVYSVFFALFGLAIGSFLNVVVYRLPHGMNLSKPSSHCPQCNNGIRWYDNIPLLSYILLGGKCRHCRCHISIRYFVVELVTAVMFVVCYLLHSDSILISALYCLLFVCLICVAIIDYEHMVIFDRFNIIIGLVGVVLCFVATDISYIDRIIGGVGLGAFFAIFYYGSILVLKREGIGFGDVKLMTACGIVLGYRASFVAVLIATIAGSIVLLIVGRKGACCDTDASSGLDEAKTPEGTECSDTLCDASSIVTEEQSAIVAEHDSTASDDTEQAEVSAKEHKEFAFAPFLVAGVAIAALWGEQIVTAYLSLF